MRFPQRLETLKDSVTAKAISGESQLSWHLPTPWKCDKSISSPCCLGKLPVTWLLLIVRRFITKLQSFHKFREPRGSQKSLHKIFQNLNNIVLTDLIKLSYSNTVNRDDAEIYYYNTNIFIVYSFFLKKKGRCFNKERKTTIKEIHGLLWKAQHGNKSTYVNLIWSSIIASKYILF